MIAEYEQAAYEAALQTYCTETLKTLEMVTADPAFDHAAFETQRQREVQAFELYRIARRAYLYALGRAESDIFAVRAGRKLRSERMPDA